jgi:uncharacterized protein YdhG (YjbR/CyaY superfamily)
MSGVFHLTHLKNDDMKNGPVATSVEAYLQQFPRETQLLLDTLRKTIRKAAPKAEESIAYGMPAYKLYGPLVYFGGYAKHIGFYPTPSGIVNFKKELEGYITSKGAIQFPIDKKLPIGLITQIVKFRVAENTEKGLVKQSKKKK